jgi:hypothetical protein
VSAAMDAHQPSAEGRVLALPVAPVRASYRHLTCRTCVHHSTVTVNILNLFDGSGMPFFQLPKPSVVPRSQVAQSNPILYDGGRAVNEFFAPGTEYFGRQVIPPDNKWSDGTRSFMGRPLYPIASVTKYYLTCEMRTPGLRSHSHRRQVDEGQG